MAEPFLSEIRIFGIDFAPKGWALCNGQFLPINQNQALFALLGTMFGGNGQTTFALPDLRARVPISEGDGFQLATSGGQAAHTLSIAEMPTHVHTLVASNKVGNSTNPNTAGTGHVFAQDPGNVYTASTANLTALNAGSVGNAGGSQPHENRQPYLALTFCIALQGLFPSPN
jgi:microcystin-dependent protein